MIDEERRQERRIEKERVRRRMRVEIDPENYEYIPEKDPVDYYDTSVHQRVAVYVRVSTDDVQQTTSYELQQKYYKDFVEHHPNWELVDIYADEGISGTSLAHRDAFNRMIKDCKDGKIDLILTKSVSRFARNIVICIGMVRELADMRPPVGVLFESEAIFSLNEDSQMALSFLATMAEEESHTRSRSMETSLRMRLDNGIPLTPKLLGYTHDESGNLIVNPNEAVTVKLAFYMYLLLYSTQEIADRFNQQKRKTFLGNDTWTANSIVNILRQERYCGDVLTRKTFTPNFRDHLSKKNRGERPQSRYLNHHEAIISRDDFIAVQSMLDNSHFQRSSGNKSLMPSLYVIERGLLRGFVRMHPRWMGFRPQDYIEAGQSFQPSTELSQSIEQPTNGFQVVRTDLLAGTSNFRISFAEGHLTIGRNIVQKLKPDYCAEFLIDPSGKRLALRSATKDNRRAVKCPRPQNRYTCNINSKPLYDAIISIFGWEPDNRYRLNGNLYEADGTVVFLFDAECAEVFLKSYKIPFAEANENEASILKSTKKYTQVVMSDLLGSFGEPFFTVDQCSLSRNEWRLNESGRIFETRKPLNITEENIMRKFVEEELYRTEGHFGEEI